MKLLVVSAGISSPGIHNALFNLLYKRGFERRKYDHDPLWNDQEWPYVARQKRQSAGIC